MKENPPDKSLTVLLREWNVDAKPGPDFAAGVWRRIGDVRSEGDGSA